MARLRSKWNLKDRDRGIEEIAGTVAANTWRIAGDGLLSLENEGFETGSQSQRLDVIAEFLAFLVHATDRLIYERMDEERRAAVLHALVLRLASIMQDNRRDADGPGDYTQGFIDLINQRAETYADCPFSQEEGPGFSFRRTFGDKVRDVMGPTDNKWIPDYVMDLEAPNAMTSLERILDGMLPSTQQAFAADHVPKGGAWGEG